MAESRCKLPPAKEPEALALWNQGRSARRIAAHFGVPKNVVDGLRRRRPWPDRPRALRTGGWDAESIATLRHLRVELKMRCGAIAQAMGKTPKAIRQAFMVHIGKMSDYPVAPRPPAPPAPKRIKRPAPKPAAPPRERRAKPPATPVPRATTPPRGLVIVSAPPAGPGERECTWPLGEPRTPGFRYCGCAALPRRPYCAGHVAVAYERPTEPRRAGPHPVPAVPRRAGQHGKLDVSSL